MEGMGTFGKAGTPVRRIKVYKGGRDGHLHVFTNSLSRDFAHTSPRLTYYIPFTQCPKTAPQPQLPKPIRKTAANPRRATRKTAANHQHD
jgi:hypothetical protein